MGIVKYNSDRQFNIGEAFEDGFGIEWTGIEGIVGLRLKDRKKPKLKVTIERTDWFMGILRVFYKKEKNTPMGWQCFDHCVEQFELDD
ncbi:MAG: hypothetical protein Q8K92_08300 [Leadbetterella sp.]|nr:hypothetical protein [Leadbetterella sp.]